jgi:hypothetical protein
MTTSGETDILNGDTVIVNISLTSMTIDGEVVQDQVPVDIIL